MKLIRLDERSRRDRLRFVKSQWRFYQGDPHWVPPLIFDRMKLLDVRRNPFYEHSKLALFLAEDRSGPLGASQQLSTTTTTTLITTGLAFSASTRASTPRKSQAHFLMLLLSGSSSMG